MVYKKYGNNIENIKKEISDIIEKLSKGVKDVYDSEKYKDYLKAMSKFHKYSFGNIMWLKMQDPNCSLVTGFRKWNDLGRKVLKGSKALKILAPMKHSSFVNKLDPVTKLPLKDPSTGEIQKEKNEWISYRTVSVFDIKQTEGKEIPSLIDELKGRADNYDLIKNAIIDVAKIPVSFENITTGSKGYYSLTDNRIAVKEGMSEQQILKTLIHETTHSRLHNLNAQKMDNKERNIQEIEAESVAFVVSNHFNLDTSDYSFGYVASWSNGKDLNDLKKSLNTIQKESNKLINEIEDSIEKTLELLKDKEITNDKVENIVNNSEIENIQNKEIETTIIDEVKIKNQLNKAKQLAELTEEGIYKDPIVLITSCENEKYFKQNEILKFSEADKKFERAEVEVTKSRKEAKENGEYIPFIKTSFKLYLTSNAAVNFKYNIGTKNSKNLTEFYNKQIKISIEKNKDLIQRKSVKEKFEKIKITNSLDKKKDVKRSVSKVEEKSI